mgnify:CR=1 FL=1
MQVKNNPFRVGALAVLALGLASTTGHAATFTVDSLLDDTFSNDSDPGDGVCRESFPNSTTCTLRAAIQEANALAGPDRIEFSVAGEIGPDSGNLGALPVITDDLVIDGTDAPGWLPLEPAIYIDGAAVNAADSSFAAGLEVTAGSLEVYGLGIVAFPGQGIDFDNGAGGGRVDGCVIGLDANGDPANHPKSLSTIGIRLRGSGALIGTSLGNVISGNLADGIQVFGDANTIARNIIGMDLAGVTARGNGGNGVFLWDTADDNVIGGSDAGSNRGNHIANNVRAGIVVDGTGNQVDGNTLGFKNESGPFFNTQTNGIEVAGDSHVIGGTLGNRIIDHTGQQNAGILLGRTPPGGDTPATNVTVEGNDIGTDSSVGVGAGIRIALAGSTSNTIRGNRIADAGIGIDMAADGNLATENRLGIDADLGLGVGPGNSIGVRITAAGNEVTFNEIGNSTSYGILVNGSANDINFNDIGFAADLGAVGNTHSGIRLRDPAVDNLIQGNRILNNGGPGVEFVNSSFISGNTVFGNSFQNNGGIAIDFLEFQLGVGSVRGPTANDPGDADSGANRRMNYPEFGEAAPIPGTDPIETVVTFRVDSEPANQTYPIAVDFYRANGYGERQGTAFLASATFDTFGTEETITLELPAGIGIDRHFTALATDADGNTSEFAPARSLGETIFRDSYED